MSSGTHPALDQVPYTARFCEENIWWLARRMVDAGIAENTLWVLLFSNAWRRVLMWNQRAFPAGAVGTWDYHVVLLQFTKPARLVHDPDTRLANPQDLTVYLARSFPPQHRLPLKFRTRVRLIPAQHYLAHFYSDRKHMRGEVAESEFPRQAIISPARPADRTSLQQYWDLSHPINSCPVLDLAGLSAFVTKEAITG